MHVLANNTGSSFFSLDWFSYNLYYIVILSPDPSTTHESPCENGGIRLLNGSSPLEGRLEICFNQAWGTVCSKRFSIEDATVACKQLGFPFNGTEVLPISEFQQGSGPIFLDKVACGGSENRLVECGGAPKGLHTCYHHQDTAIRCIGEYHSIILQSIANNVTNFDQTLTNVLLKTEGVIKSVPTLFLVISVAAMTFIH